MREVLTAMFLLNRAECQWDMLPHDLPAKSTVYDHFAQWMADGMRQTILDVLRRVAEVCLQTPETGAQAGLHFRGLKPTPATRRHALGNIGSFSRFQIPNSR